MNNYFSATTSRTITASGFVRSRWRGPEAVGLGSSSAAAASLESLRPQTIRAAASDDSSHRPGHQHPRNRGEASMAAKPPCVRPVADARTSAESNRLGARRPRRSSARSPRNPPPAAPTTRHARNQVGRKAAAAVAPRGGMYVGWRSQGRRTKGARPSIGAARHATEGRSPIPRADHDPRDAGATVVPLAARVWGAPARHRGGVGGQVPRDPLLYPAGPRPLHRRG
jgi:hypothetical protein